MQNPGLNDPGLPIELVELEQGSWELIYEFIKSCESDFPSAVTASYDLHEYARKLDDRAVVLVSQSRARKIEGMIAFYCNDSVSRRAHLTYFAVSAPRRGSGVAEKLLDACLTYCKSAGMKSLTAETWKENMSMLRWTKHQVSRWAASNSHAIRAPQSGFGDKIQLEIFLHDD